MARAPNEKVKQAEKLYREGLKLVEIAEALNIPSGTVRRWKKTYKWDEEAPQAESERSDKNSERSLTIFRENKEQTNKPEQETDNIAENSELTEKQALFCQYYVRSKNATQAYKKAYGCSYKTAMANGSSILRNTKVKSEVERLKKLRNETLMLEEQDLVEQYLKIAFADMSDYVKWGRTKVPMTNNKGEVIYEKDENGKRVPIMREINELKFIDSSEVDGSLITEVRLGKDGVSIKLADRLKALDWLYNYYSNHGEEDTSGIAQFIDCLNHITQEEGTQADETNREDGSS